MEKKVVAKRRAEVRLGTAIPLRIRNNENPNIINWYNAQDNISDSIRFLIEKEVALNGIANLQERIPPSRTEEYWEQYKQREDEIIKKIIDQRIEERLQEYIQGNEKEFFENVLKKHDIKITIHDKD